MPGTAYGAVAARDASLAARFTHDFERDLARAGSEPMSEFLVELGKLRCSGLVVFLQEPQGFPDNFTGGVVAAGLHFGGHELL